MKKTLVAIAVSSAALTSMSSFAAEDTVNFDVYGNIQLAYIDSDASNTSEIKDNGSTFGFQGSTAINDDLTGFFKYELEADADEKTSDIDVNLDQAYVGLQGGFGKVQVGSFDTIYNNAIQDTYDQFEALGVHQGQTVKEGDTIAYFSPSFGGFEFQASAAIKDSAENNAPESEDGTAANVVLKYSVEAMTVAVGYDDGENTGDGESSTTGLNITYQVTPALSVGAQYEEVEDFSSAFGLAARFNYGSGDVYTTIQNVDLDDEVNGISDYNVYGVGVTYNLASNMYVYAEYGQNAGFDENDAVVRDDDKTTAVGATYLF
ncbi:Major outer membrane protein P.IB precursor [Marinomonas gallaica]|uniref:Major outer membrane protein P.IB n=1 Tax=Marinomonas gallaica TaxID=1806667 RepID=A0A1C3JLV2_9GAMM|nr:porin [Marinomonas gallaica]SBT16183.1 Major outer membrane protein P.IB precursor [Marinomonas gallaica]SBT21231.1 Major outer membrane protein P.IB precursor [Marinomonas gallaica]